MIEEPKEKSKLGLVQIFWGNGKGKTTSALGTALRACGNGYRVHLIQFMKNGMGDEELLNPGELKSLMHLEGFSFKRFGAGSWVIGKPKPEHIEKAQEALAYVKECFNKEYDILLVDEILYAVQLGLLQEDEVIELIKMKPKEKELILTGSHKPYERIFEHADLVSEIRKIKHPYDKGILARKGIEY